jgi:hypothetical protein
MKPIFFTLNNDLHIMAIPDTDAHLDGHPVITYTYSLFIDQAKGNPQQALKKESTLHLDKIKDPDYLGFIAFETPANVFSYTGGERSLTVAEIEEVIEHLNLIRDNPPLWRSMDNL